PFDLASDFPSTNLVECDYTNNMADYVIENLLPPISGGNQYACSTSESTPTLLASARLSGEGTLQWYDAPVGGNIVGEPSLSSVGEVIYYAQTTLGAYSSVRTPVLLRIDPSPELTPAEDLLSCGPYILPIITGTNLTGNEAYYTEPNGGGTQYVAGDEISLVGEQTLYVYDSLQVVESCPVNL